MMLDAIRSALAPEHLRRVLLFGLTGVMLAGAGCATTTERRLPDRVARPQQVSSAPVGSTLAIEADAQGLKAQRNEPQRKPAPRLEPMTSPFPPPLGADPMVINVDDEQ